MNETCHDIHILISSINTKYQVSQTTLPFHQILITHNLIYHSNGSVKTSPLFVLGTGFASIFTGPRPCLLR
jgi:hypothetical protein